jgi:hypothetical protein
VAVSGALGEAEVITGHFGLAAGSKAAGPAAPLWALMLATMWLDVVFVPLFAMNVETIDTVGGGGYGKSVIHANYTHSLVGALILSAVLAAVGAWRWGRRLGLLLGVVAFSHWVLDLVVHRADLPLLPGNAGDLPLLGFGLWRVPVASVLVEAALLLGGTYLYWRASQQSAGGPPAGGRVTPNLVSLVILASGAVVLALDVVGV